jgi:hypothetical protein
MIAARKLAVAFAVWTWLAGHACADQIDVLLAGYASTTAW